MLCALLVLLAGIAAGLIYSIIKTNAQRRLTILMLLLAHEESGSENYIEISYGQDPKAVQKLLHAMVKGGYLDQRLIVDVTAPRRMHVRELYKLTPAGSKFARLLRAHYIRRNR